MTTVAVRERPILFSAPMVRALLAGSKTQTRRAVKSNIAGRVERGGKQWHIDDPNAVNACPYGQPGDRLWAREAWGLLQQQFDHESHDVVYRADVDTREPKRWRPSIHMPRWASRILLEITEVRVERLQAISDADAIAEGCPGGHDSIPGYGYNALPAEQFMALWKSINGAGSWRANPWVWVVSFKRISPPLPRVAAAANGERNER